jgi:hypothetical protein
MASGIVLERTEAMALQEFHQRAALKAFFWPAFFIAYWWSTKKSPKKLLGKNHVENVLQKI